MKRKIRLLLLLAATTLLLAACRVVVDTNIASDGSGELRTSIVYTAEEKQDFEQKPESEGKSICDGAKEGVPAGATFVEEVHDGETYCVTERHFNNLAELRNFYSSMDRVTVNTLEFEPDRFVLDIDVDQTDNGDGQGLDNEWRLTLPGNLVAHNATRVEGQTLVWEISAGQESNIRAETQVQAPPASSSLGMAEILLVLAVGVIIVLALVGVVLIILLLRSRRKAAG